MGEPTPEDRAKRACGREVEIGYCRCMQIAAEIKAAVRAERERCAKVVQQWFITHPPELPPFPRAGPPESTAIMQTCHYEARKNQAMVQSFLSKIAAAIREGEDG